MDNNKDFYNILGLTEEDKKLPKDEFNKKIKGIYRKMSIMYHPDKQAGKSDAEKKAAEEKFKEVSEAYDTLSDDNKRQQYDMQKNGFDGFDFGGFDFGGFGGNPFGNIFDHFGGGRKQQRVVKGEDLDINVNLTLEDVLNGATKTFKFFKNVACSHCNGTGSKDGKVTTCPQCNGTGRIRNIQRHGNQTFVSESYCPHCHGTGKTASESCPHCGGNGVKRETVTKTIAIPKGFFEGAYMSFTNEGNAPVKANGDAINGDLNVMFHLLPHSKFTVEGQNLKMDLKVNLYEALCGAEKNITCLDGSTINVKIPELTENGKLLKINGKGLPNVNMVNNIGSLIIRVVYEMPKKKLADKQIDLLKEFYEIEKKRNN